MDSEIKELDRKGLREFGLTMGGIVAALFGLIFPWLLELTVPLWPWVVAGVLVVWSLLLPLTLRLAYKGWMRLGMLMNKITTPVIMGAVFFLVITPMGIVRRTAGKDSLRRQFERISSYRIPSTKSPTKNLERPF